MSEESGKSNGRSKIYIAALIAGWVGSLIWMLAEQRQMMTDYERRILNLETERASLSVLAGRIDVLAERIISQREDIDELKRYLGRAVTPP